MQNLMINFSIPKLLLQTVDGLAEEEMKILLEVGYEIEDQERVIHRFVPELLKKMDIETGWNW